MVLDASAECTGAAEPGANCFCRGALLLESRVPTKILSANGVVDAMPSPVMRFPRPGGPNDVDMAPSGHSGPVRHSRIRLGSQVAISGTAMASSMNAMRAKKKGVFARSTTI